MQRCRQYSGATASVSAADSCMSNVLLPGAQPSLQLIILAGRAHCWNSVQRDDCYFIDTTAYAFEMTDSLLPWDEWHFTPLWWMTVCLECLAFIPCDHAADCSVIGGWAKHVTAVGRTATSALLQLGHIKGLFLSCGAALTSRVGVRCSVCVSAHERALSDYSGRFLHHIKFFTCFRVAK